MLSKDYLMRQAKTLLRLASVSSDPLVAGTLAEKALEIKERLEAEAAPIPRSAAHPERSY